MNASGQVLFAAAVAIVILMVGTWLLSVKLKDASIVDIVWGLGFVVVAWTVRLVADGNSGRGWLLTILTTLWGLRLAIYLFWRNHGKGEDYRYRSMRKHYGKRFAVVSLVTVFGLQGALMWVVSLPVQLGQVRSTPSLGVLAIIGVVVWAIGLAFESIGDAQLVRFKADPDNSAKVMDTGLWRYTRHPNYFGDACVWWGLAIVAAESRLGLFGLIGAATMTLFLRRVSGVTLLERSLVKRREGYTEYVARTSPFVPRAPRKLPAIR